MSYKCEHKKIGELDVFLPTKVSEYRLKYPCQTNIQPAFVEVYWASSQVTVEFDPEIGNAVPFYVFHRKATRYYFSAEMTLKQARKYAMLIAERAAKLLPYYEEIWDGNNYKGRFPGHEDEFEKFELECYNLLESV